MGTSYTSGKTTVAAHTGGELALNEHDTITGVHDMSTGDGDDVLIGAGGNPGMHPGVGVNLCDPNGDDAVPPASC